MVNQTKIKIFFIALLLILPEPAHSTNDPAPIVPARTISVLKQRPPIETVTRPIDPAIARPVRVRPAPVPTGPEIEPLPAAIHTEIRVGDSKAPVEPAPIAWTWNPPGLVTAPILLYHRIEDHGPNDRFRVSPSDFQAQMLALKAWGYTTIPLSLLVDAVMVGAELPPRPVVITFDDGWRSVYDQAFPIMQDLGMVGVVYIVSSGIYSDPTMMHVAELEELAAAGWEIGSHTRTHADLTQCPDTLRQEVAGSRADLETALDLPVRTIAFPFGLIDEDVLSTMWAAGYSAGVGLGNSSDHTTWTLHYLSRREVHGTMVLAEFEQLLPWSSDTIGEG